MKCGALFTSRRVSASVTVNASLVIESPKPAVRSAAERHRPATVPDDHPELRARWHALPKRIRPEDWTTQTGITQVPGSLLVAEAERRPEGFAQVVSG